MNAMQQLEGMGYRFRLDGNSIRYTLYGGSPPVEAESLLRRLDKDFVRAVLQARRAGCVMVKPQIVRVPWGDRYRYMAMIYAAKTAGELADVKVTFIRSTRECVYELLPPGVDFMKYDVLKEIMHGEEQQGIQ